MNEDRIPLITVEQFMRLSRPTSIHLDDEEVKAYIREAEDIYIIPFIGYATLKAITSNERPQHMDESFAIDILANGGEWTEIIAECKGDTVEEIHYCNGIRKAAAYYTYAKMIRADGSILSRAGAMRHRDEYSDHVDDSKLKQYNDAMSIAERYLSESIAYMNAHSMQKKKARGTRAHIHAIGD